MRRAGRLFLKMSAGALGVGLAVLVGVALARSFTLGVAKKATVTNAVTHKSKRENIVVAGGGFAVYTLSGDSKRHPECTKAKGCFGLWPPVTVPKGKKPTKASGIKGKLGTWKRNGFVQVTLAGHPLYFYAGDSRRRHANGQAIVSFGGTWRVVRAGSKNTTSTVPTATTTMPTTTIPYP